MNFTEEAFAKLNAELMVQNFQKADRIKELEAALNKYSEDETLCKWTDRIKELEQALDVALEALENGKRVRNCEGGTKYQPDLEDHAIAKLKEVRRD